MTRTKHIFISPHYDDVVYSLGGLLNQLYQQQQEIHVITVMAGFPPKKPIESPIVKALHTRWNIGSDPIQERRKEDHQALALFNASSHYLDIPDCIYRSVDGIALYPDEDSLWERIHPHDPALSQLDQLNDFISDQDQLYFPLGVGDHVDHLLVRNWGIQYTQAHPDQSLYFYAEFPYSAKEKSRVKALNDFPLRLHLELPTLTPADIEVKLQAIKLYASQFSSFWQSDAELREMIYDALISLGTQQGEPLWHKI
ncbi:PIG-L family deacetylase [Anaerolineales bacterium]